MRPLACPRPTGERMCADDGNNKNRRLAEGLGRGVRFWRWPCAWLCLRWPFPSPSGPENQYVLDEAEVLSEETEQEIIDTNNACLRETGAQVVVVAVDFLWGARTLRTTPIRCSTPGASAVWSANNGLLLLLAIGEDNYYAMSGYGLEDYFDGRQTEGNAQ